MVNPTVIKVAKILVSVVGAGATLASTYFEGKEMEAKIAKEVAKQLADRK